jgi:hypothetical protein
VVKEVGEFYNDKTGKDGLRWNCKACQREKTAEWRKENPEHNKRMQQKWREVNKERSMEVSRLWRRDNPERFKIQCREWYIKNREYAKKTSQEWRANNSKRHIESVLKWRKANPEKAREFDRKSHAKIMATPPGKLNASMTSLIGRSLRGNKNGRRWEDLAGFTCSQLKKHLEKQFDKNMTWDNYGKYWHIDHKIPRSAFNFKTAEDFDFRRCWCLKNLQPLEAKANLSKGAKILGSFQFGLGI